MKHIKWHSLALCCLITSMALVGCIGFVDTTTDDDDDEDSSETSTSTSTETTTSSSDAILCEYFVSEFNDSTSIELDSKSQWTCTTTSRVLVANGIPEHDVDEDFPSDENPYTITEQSVVASITLTPDETTTSTPLDVPGYMLNGVKIQAGPEGSCDDTGENCDITDNSGNWNIEVLTQDVFDFGTDENNAHVDSDGSYHYHGVPEGLFDLRNGSSTTMTIIGWAVDGFPIYARYGYSDADDDDSTVKIITASYQMISEDEVSSSRPSIEDFPLGTFEQDWEYVSGSGDLDECNGREGVTPEFPDGIYHYYATDTYPFLQRCVNGDT